MTDTEKYSVDKIKAFLVSYKEHDRDIENQLERLDRLETKIIGVGAQVLTDMPKNPSPSNDRITDLLCSKTDLENEIKGMIKEQSDSRRLIEFVIKRFKKSDEKAVIRMRYIDGLVWTDVTDALFGGKDDYLGKEDTYLRRTTMLHGQALLHMSEYIEHNESPEISEIRKLLNEL